MSNETRTFPFRRTCPFDLAEDYAELRRTAPVVPVALRRTGARAWLLTRHDDVRAVLTDPRFDQGNTAGAAPGGGSATAFGTALSDPVAHKRWRRVVNGVFSVRQAESVRARIAAMVEDTLDELERAGQPGDLMADYAFRLSIRTMCVALDMPEHLATRFEDWAEGLHAVTPSFEAFTESMRVLHDTATELVALARAQPDGLLGSLMAATDDDSTPLTDDELVATILLLVFAGHESTAIQIGNGVYALLDHPEQLDLLRRDESLLEPAVEEILRYALVGTGFTGARQAPVDVDFDGVTVPAGETVLVSLDSAGRDESRVDNPERFDITRGAARNHLSFGVGSHFCLGAPLARVVLQEGIARLLRRFPGLKSATDLSAVEFTSNRFNHYPRALRVHW
ncbi:cytochrome P450 [Actinokineospora soli]|uniref:Cytochrome P450 n=1 Tax=Actinokineospora soli TaxID=1048753 RepID=A0ABW2TMZ2_9PSEU